MQPTYLPWAGYMNLMASVDLFIYLDDAQYERASWQNRNRVLVAGVPAWLTVPVLRQFLGEPIHRVALDERVPWRRKHAALLIQAYARHEHAADLREAADRLMVSNQVCLADLNIALLSGLRERLAINTPTLRSSELQVEGARTDRLVSLLAKVGATDYVTPPGALDYLRNDDFAGRAAQRLWVHAFNPAPYPQRGAASFVSHLSILDAVAQIGWQGAARYIRPTRQTVVQESE